MRTTSSRAAAVALATLLGLAACGSDSSPVATDGSEDVTTTTEAPPTTQARPSGSIDALVGRDWVVDARYTVGGLHALPTEPPVVLTFVDEGDGAGLLTLRTGCNIVEVDVTYDSEHTLTAGDVDVPETDCLLPDTEALDAATGVLDGPVSWNVVDGSELSLIPTMVSDSGVHLHAPAPPDSTPPTDPDEVPTTEPALQSAAALNRTTWVAERFITVGPEDRLPTNERVTLEFRGTQDIPSSVDINVGCDSDTADVSFTDDGSMHIWPVATKTYRCPDVDADLQRRVLGLLSGDMRWNVSGDRMTILPASIDDAGIVLRRLPTTLSEPEDTLGESTDIVIAAFENAAGPSSRPGPVGLVDGLGTGDLESAMIGHDGGRTLQADERAAIAAALAPRDVVWLPADPAVLRDAVEAGEIAAYISVSDPVISGDEAAIVTNVFCGPFCGTGRALTVTRQADGSWTITDVGATWIA